MKTRVVAIVAAHLKLPPRAVDPRRTFASYGFSSVSATQIVAALSEEFGRPLPLTLLWDCPDVPSLVAYLAGERAAPGGASRAASTRRAPQRRGAHEPIAIIGVACRFSRAGDPTAFWELLRAGEHTITPIPRQRAYLRTDPETEAQMPGAFQGSFLDSIDGFDPQVFGISPREAAQMDPQQRLMLELSWEALEDAAIPTDRLRGARVGVFFGAIWGDFALLQAEQGASALAEHASTGSHRSIIANRVSFALGLRGPSMTVDTACSASLASVHLACQSLRAGESTMALAGGVNLMASPQSSVSMARLGALSREGRVRAFDASADGYVRGEGGAAIVLKPLSRALADGDPIHACIRGSALNNNGRSLGLTAPSQDAQEQLLRDAYDDAGIEPRDVHYVEAHGTGTRLGDPMEAKALGAVLGRASARERPLRIGSVKTNIGHLEAAAGIAGLVKVVLAMRHGELPASLHFETPNPHIPFAECNLEVQRERGPWPSGGERLLAAVSSFGFGGTNCHVVLEEHRPASTDLLVASADSEEGLKAVARSLKQVASQGAPLGGLCRMASSVLAPWRPQRLAVTARSTAELEARLDAFLRGEHGAGVTQGAVAEGRRPSIAFVFAGQGGQWLGMGRELLAEEPRFRRSLERIDAALRRHGDVAALDVLSGAVDEPAIERIPVMWPVLFALGVALAELFRALGIEPDAVIGHSIGEVAAAHVAGALDLDQAARIICHQARLVGRESGRGAMALVGLPWDEARAAVEREGGRVSCAIHASPASTVLSGDAEAVRAVLRALEARGVFCRIIPTDAAVHSPAMASLCEALVEELGPLATRATALPLIAASAGGVVPGEALDARFWADGLSRPVLLTDAIHAAARRGCDTFLEIGPHPILVRSIEECLAGRTPGGLVLGSLRRGEGGRAPLLDALAALYCRGARPAWGALRSRDERAVPLPHELAPHVRETPEVGDAGGPMLLPLSAASQASLRALAERLRAALVEAPSSPELADLHLTATAGRAHLEHRVAFVVSSREELAAELDAFARRGEVIKGTSGSRRPLKVAFVFPGQGGQWAGMGRRLGRRAPAFRDALADCDRALRRHVDWSLLDLIDGRPGAPELDRIDVVQPALFAVEVALAALWRSFGIEPAVVVGHSMGEVAAASVSGALSLDDAAAIICGRSRLMRRVSGRGAMAIVELSSAEAAELIRGREDQLSIAAANSFSSTVLSGEPGAIAEVLAALERRGVFCRSIKVDVASHSPQMQPLAGELAGLLARIAPRSGAVPFFSTVSAGELDGALLDAGYWAKNLREPVRFADAVAELEAAGVDAWIEVSPHPVLVPDIEQTLRARRREPLDPHATTALVRASLRRNEDEWAALMSSLGALYAHGAEPEWRAIDERGGRPMSMPSYPWERKVFPLFPEGASVERSRRRPLRASSDPRALFPSLRPVEAAVPSGVRLWEVEIDRAELPLLYDHRLGGAPVLPASAYVELLAAITGQLYGAATFVLRGVQFLRALFLDPEAPTVLQVRLELAARGQAAFSVHARSAGSAPQESPWVQHARGTLVVDGAPDPRIEPGATTALPGHAETGEAFYERLSARGVAYGPRLRAVERFERRGDEASARVTSMAQHDAAQESWTRAALLDACFQLAARALLPDGASAEASPAFVPVSADALRLLAAPPGPGWIRSAVHRGDGAQALQSIRLFDEAGRLTVEITGLASRRLEEGASAPAVRLEDSLIEPVWAPLAPAAAAAAPARPWLLFVDEQGIGAALAELLRAQGREVVTVEPAETFLQRSAARFEARPGDTEAMRRVLQAVSSTHGAPERLVHLWSVDARPLDVLAPEGIEASQRCGASSVLQLARALVDVGWETRTRLWVATRGAQQVAGQPVMPRDEQAPVWGLVQAIAAEHRPSWGGIVDLDPASAPLAAAAALAREVAGSGPEDRLAYRGEQRYGLRLVPYAARLSGARLGLRRDGAYLITGGLGDLGLVVGRWLAEQGARRLLLLGRTGLPPRSTWAGLPAASAAARQVAVVREMEALGATVEAVALDVADGAALRRFLAARADAAGAPIRGVLHAAGVVDDRLIADLDNDSLLAVLRPKLAGGAALLESLDTSALDFFVLFSSIASLVGSVGQGSYAAANAALDALAERARGRGVPALSVHWGYWSGLGFSSSAGAQRLFARWAARGVRSFPAELGLEALSRLLDDNVVRAAVFPVDWSTYAASCPEGRLPALLERMAERAAPAQPAEPAEPAERSLRATLAALESADERRRSLESRLKTQVAQVLRVTPSEISATKPLGALGLDSILSLELRNRIEALTGLALSSTMVWNYPTIADMIQFLLREMQLETAEAAPAPQAVPISQEQGERLAQALLALKSLSAESLLS